MNKSFTFKKIFPSILIIAVLATGIFSTLGVKNVKAITNNPPTTFTLESDYSVLQGVKIRSATDPNGDKLKPADYAVGKTLPKGTTISTYKNEIPKFGSSIKKDSVNIAGGGNSDATNPDDEEDSNSCHWYWWSISGCINWVATLVGQAVLSILALFVGIAGWLLDYVVTYTILEMGANVNGVNGEGGIGFIEDGWKMFRDLANIVIIFALLVIGIATILRYEGYGMKKLLGMLIVVALLINFSLFFTQVIIDSTNLLALQFYNKILAIHGGGGWTGIGYAYMDAFKLTTIYNAKGVFDPQTLTKPLLFHQIFLVSALGSVVYLVAIFSFLAGAFLLIGRFVALIFLMVLSPLAFVGMILPATQSYASKWWSALFKYSIFAPIYMILTWFVINVVTSDAFKKSIGLLDSTQMDQLKQLANIGKGGAETIASLPIIMNFVLIVFFMMASLIIANQMGIAGSSAVMKWGKSARKWGQGVVGGAAFGGAGRIMRTTAGRGASKWADSEGLKAKAAKGGIFGTLARTRLRGLRGVAGSSFDVRATKAGGAIAGAASLGKAGGKGGYEEKLKQQVEARVKFARDVLGKAEKTKVERSDEQKVRATISLSNKGLAQAKERLEQAKAQHPTNSPQVQQEERLVKMAENRKVTEEAKLGAIQEQITKRGIERQQQYADTLETEKTIDTAFIKVPRKGKKGADAIRKDIKNAPNKKVIDEIVKQMKASSSVGGVPPTGGTPGSGGGASSTTP